MSKNKGMTQEEMKAISQSLSDQRNGKAQREKAEIVRVGTIDADTGQPIDFVFDGHGRNVAALDISMEQGEMVYRYGGYTIDELAEIVRSTNQ